jgi:hypothetical protein
VAAGGVLWSGGRRAEQHCSRDAYIGWAVDMAGPGTDSATDHPTTGGAVARNPLTGSEQAKILVALRAGENRMTPLDERTVAMPRAPLATSVLVWDAKLPAAADVLAFGWAQRGVVVITWEMAEQGHLAGGAGVRAEPAAAALRPGPAGHRACVARRRLSVPCRRTIAAYEP